MSHDTRLQLIARVPLRTRHVEPGLPATLSAYAQRAVLLSLAAVDGKRTSGAEIADMSGVGVECVYRCIKILIREGLVQDTASNITGRNWRLYHVNWAAMLSLIPDDQVALIAPPVPPLTTTRRPA